MADRYTGRHIRQARHGAWVTKKRSRPAPMQLAPIAAALTVAGVLIGGAGAVIQLGSPAPVSAAYSPSYDAATYPTGERGESPDRASQAEPRQVAAAQPMQPAKPKQTASLKQTASRQPAVVSRGECKASYYDEPQPTANGEQFDPQALTAASKTLPFNTRVRVINDADGASVVVRINDRGPFVAGRCLSLSEAAFASIADLGTGIVDVHYEVLAEDAT